jgi:hypothetical protein
METDVQVSRKQRDDLVHTADQKKTEDARLLARVESLQKDIAVLRIQAKNETTKRQGKLEAAYLSLLVPEGEQPDFKALGLGEDASKQDVEEYLN